jgi:adenosyl cobinamide kinase/adenosyl cobinamide phosphate guanylyltransferase
VTLVLLAGGARSGKSDLAVRLGRRWAGPVTVVATAEAGDADMAARIERHRGQRPAAWATVEEPVALADALARPPDGALVLVDCLTLWVANLLGRGLGEADVLAAGERAAAAAAARAAPVVVVTNEVGLGVVPATPAGREFRDALGRVNRAFAGRADEAWLVVAGRALPLAPWDAVGARTGL